MTSLTKCTVYETESVYIQQALVYGMLHGVAIQYHWRLWMGRATDSDWSGISYAEARQMLGIKD